MKTLFADTFFYLALLNPRDVAHQQAVEFSESHVGPVLTTQWVLTEVADALARPDNRLHFVHLLEDLQKDPNTAIEAATDEMFNKGCELYASRRDKSWSLTDCISFHVMGQRGITEALTGDRHFEQAGFAALLKD